MNFLKTCTRSSQPGSAFPLGRLDAMCLLGLTVLVLLIYGSTIGFGPVNLDDPVALENNPLVSEVPPGPGQVVAAIWYIGPLNLWHPVTWWSHQMDSLIFGFPAWGARHLTNMVLHWATVVLLYLTCRRLSGSWVGAFFAAMLFALHPQRVEAVAWLTSRKELLAGIFVLLAALSWMRWQREGGKWWWVSFFAFVAAVASHPVAVVFAAVLPFLDRCGERPKAASVWRRGIPGQDYLAFFFVGILVSLGTLAVHRESGLAGLEATHGLGDRFGRVLLGAWYYTGSGVWPVQQRLFEIPSADPARLGLMTWGGIAVLAGCLFALRRFMEENWRVPLLGAVWTLLFLLPVSGVVAMTPYLGADRYTYLPHMGLAILLAGFWPRRPAFQWGAGAVAVLVAGLYFTGSAHRLADWKNSETLFRAEVEASPRSKLALLHLGAAFLDGGHPEESLIWFEKSLEIDPDFDLAQANIKLAKRRIEEKSPKDRAEGER